MKPETQDILEELDRRYGIALYGFTKEDLENIKSMIDLVMVLDGDTVENESDMEELQGYQYGDGSLVEFDNID